MFDANSFGKNLGILHKSLDVAWLRRSVLANNLANAETPNFKRSDVNFESQLKRALDSESSRTPLAALRTDSRHIDFGKKISWKEVTPKRVLDHTSSTKNNNNNVDVEQEGIAIQQNQLMYQTMTQVVANQFSRINIVLK